MTLPITGTPPLDLVVQTHCTGPGALAASTTVRRTQLAVVWTMGLATNSPYRLTDSSLESCGCVTLRYDPPWPHRYLGAEWGWTRQESPIVAVNLSVVGR